MTAFQTHTLTATAKLQGTQQTRARAAATQHKAISICVEHKQLLTLLGIQLVAMEVTPLAVGSANMQWCAQVKFMSFQP